MRTLFFLCLLLFLPSLTRAAPSNEQQAEALALYEKAEVQYRLLEYEKALALYKEAYVLSKESSLLFNIAQCYRLMGRYQEAKQTYELYLTEAPDSSYRESCERFLKEVTEAAKSAPVPSTKPTPALSVSGSPSPALSKKVFFVPAGLGAFSLVMGGAALIANHRLLEETDPLKTEALRNKRLSLALTSDAFLLLSVGTLAAFSIERFLWHRERVSP
jgi:tetratricopeptide (TPR) repeat protein